MGFETQSGYSGGRLGHTFLHVQFPIHDEYICGSWEGIHDFRCQSITNFRQKIWNGVLRTIQEDDWKAFCGVFLNEKEAEEALKIVNAEGIVSTGLSLRFFLAQSKPFILAINDMDIPEHDMDSVFMM